MIKLYLISCTLYFLTASLYPYSQIVLRNIGYSQSLVGVILALGQLSSCIVPLFIGNLADKTGRAKFIYIIAVSALLASQVIFIYIPLLPVVLVFFILTYACAGCTSSLSDTLLNLSSSKYGIPYSSVRSSGTFAYVFALVLFTLLGFPNPDSNKQILLTQLFSGAFLLTALFIFENPVEPRLNAEEKSESKSFNPKWFEKGFYLLSAVVFIKTIGCAVVEKFLGSYMTEVLNLGNKFTIFVALGAFSEGIFMFLFGKLLKKGKIKEVTLIILSCVGLIIRLILYVISKSLIVFTIAQLFHCLTFSASHVAMISYIQKHVKKEHTSLATAIYTSIDLNAAQFLGSLGAGFIIDKLGYNALFEIYAIFPAMALVLCLTFKKKAQI